MLNAYKYRRIVGAIGGSAGIAVCSLILALCLMQQSTSDDYGLFAFLLVAQAFLNGISNAILGAPLLIKLADDNSQSLLNTEINSFIQANLLFCVVAASIQALTVYAFESNYYLSACYFFCGFILTFRWFCRIFYSSKNEHSKVAASDFIYTISCIFGAVFIYIFNSSSLLSFSILMSCASVLSLFVFDSVFFKINIKSLSKINVIPFLNGWHCQGKYALTGVVSTEAVANAHVYLITIFYGPKFFAPIAAATLLFRPTMVVLTGLLQTERPRLRSYLVGNEVLHVNKKIKEFLLINILFLFSNMIAVSVFLYFFSEKYWKETETLSYFFIAAICLALVRFVNVFNVSMSMYLQASDLYKELASITLKSSFFTIPVVALLIYIINPAASLLGVILGELLSFSLLSRLYFSKRNEK